MNISRYIIRIIDFVYDGIKPLRKIIPLQTFRYAVCGGFNTLFGWIIYSLIYKYVACDFVDMGFAVMSRHIQALFIQFPLTFFLGFWLNRNVAFRLSPVRGRVQLVRYVISVAGSFLLNYLLMKLFVEGMSIYAPVAKPLTDAVVIVYSYLMQKYLTFRGSKT